MAEDANKEVNENVNEEAAPTVEEVATEQKNGEEIHSKEIAAVNAIIHPAPEDAEKKVDKEKKTEEVVEDDKKTTPEVKAEAEDKSTPKPDDKSDATPNLTEQVKALNLPGRLLQAAKRNHLSDEAIIELGDKAELVLTRLAANSDEVSKQLGELGRKVKATITPKKEEKSTLEVKINEDDLPEVKELKTLIQSLAGEVSSLKKETVDRASAISQKEIDGRDMKIDSMFDAKASELPELGDTKSLTEAQMAIRQTIFANADNIMVGAKVNGQKKTWEEALVESISIYESETPKKKLSREQLLKEVETREKNIISRGASKKKSTVEVTDPHKAQVGAVAKLLKRGQEGW